jgi:Ca2+-transporting ATPase
MISQGAASDPQRWYALDVDPLARELGSSPEAGLSDAEAARRLERYGPNELPKARSVSPLTIFLRQFSNIIVGVLIAAAVVSGLLQDWVDAAAIFAIVLLNALLGFVQEYKAERSLSALKKMTIMTARVIRSGVVRIVPARELVPGDLIQLEAGDHVPADTRLVYSAALRTQEAPLTGESTPVKKAADALSDPALPLADRRNMTYFGTTTVAGRGRGLVVETGLRTELGRIAELMQQAEPETTPLQRRLEQFGHVLLYVSLGVVTIVFVLGLLRGEPLVEMFLTAVSLAVAAIPEGLPAIVTITLALGVHSMAKRHALIRRLPAVETLGSTTVICTDKTGTLTKNEMTVTRLVADGRTFHVTGEGYEPRGEIQEDGRSVEAAPGIEHLLAAAALCNGASLLKESGGWKILGDPTEGALLVAAAKTGLWKHTLEAAQPLLRELPFDPERKMMTMVRRAPEGPVAYVKGAPDVLLGRCSRYETRAGSLETLTDALRTEILSANAALAHEALRVLAIARRPLDRDPHDYSDRDLEQDLVFLGLVAMKDPPRPEVREAIAACRGAGIRTVMITGDHKETAIAMGSELGLLAEGDQAMAGTELDPLSDGELTDRVSRIAIYARVSAEHKLRIVRAWKRQDAVVAMTGDGVNDAPAIKEADIGIAMGLTGTDVTKEASDMVVTDDNFASIVAAVEAGRALYGNIRKAIQYLLACNLSEVLVMLLAALVGLPLPLLPVQILWINLVTDGLPALALAVDPADSDLMRRPPRHPKAPLLSFRRMRAIFVHGLLLALVTILGFVYTLYIIGGDLERARTITFTILVMAQLFYALTARSDHRSIVSLGVLTNKALLAAVAGSALLQVGIILNPWTRTVFDVTPLSAHEWLLAFGLGLVPLVAMEAWKMLRGSTRR